jgi:hypothetical protein
MSQIRDWHHDRDLWLRVLERQTGQGLEHWNGRIEDEHPADEQSLRAWLTEQGVTGYAQTLLVRERFGYPDFVLAAADELIDRQYADRLGLRPIFDAVIASAATLGEVIVQARKTYVSLLTPRRTFARVQPAKTRVDVALRLEDRRPGGRLQPSTIHETMSLQISLTSVDQVDAELLGWLQLAYEENR